jgi:preprotein translocase subunit SecA
MSTATLLHLLPGDIAPGRPYVERDEHEPPWHDKLALRLWHGGAMPVLRRLRERRGPAFVALVDRHADAFAAASDDGLRAEGRRIRAELRRLGFTPPAIARCFALVREAATRVLGKRHYDSQLQAGAWLLRGLLVEMATGEGKTFAATLPACTAALAGLPVHVITVNDYLAARDAETMAPLYRFFGLRCAAVVHGMGRPERRAAYASDIVYCSNKELAFDYLRDRAALGDRASRLHLAVEGLRDAGPRDAATVLRGLSFAIVDEADSVFIDEARTPLILSATIDADAGREPCALALGMARALAEGVHFSLERGALRVRLTEAGRDEIDAQAEAQIDAEAAPAWASPRERDESVQRALAAIHLYARDKQYVVMDGKVQIVDESTGRVMADRAWERGLHQMIEAKEGVALTGQRQTLARITYQRLFRRYLRVGGMTGTATEVASEIGRTYGLSVVRAPLHRPSQRSVAGVCGLSNAAAKWQAVAESVRRAALEQGRPVLIGTRTVAASEAISAVLHAQGIEHVVLNAKQDSEEARIVADAGLPGRVTVATNMAGRGTDIALGPGVAEAGGLHVILTEYHDSRRIDRQLLGRCARQGDPGSCEAFVAFDDELFQTQAPWLARRLRDWSGRRPAGLPPWATELLRRVAQAAAEARHRDIRMQTLRQDRQLSKILAFSGRGE